ncbi:MAG: hypothetical protein CMF51_02955 [Legionellales bacterium]|nr:hypothetical protein [Legionellales bacterium]
MHTLVEANTRAINVTLCQYLEFEALLHHHQDKVPEHCLVFPQLNLNFHSAEMSESRNAEMCKLNLKSYQHILTQMHQLIDSNQALEGFRFEGGDETSSTVLYLFKVAGLINNKNVYTVEPSLLQGQHGIIYLDGYCYHFRLTTPTELSNWTYLIECIQNHKLIEASQLDFKNEKNIEIARELLLNWNEKNVTNRQNLEQVSFEYAQINNREILEETTQFKDQESDFKQFLTFTLSDYEGTEGSLDQLDHTLLLRKYDDLNQEIRASLAGMDRLQDLKETFMTMILRKHKPEIAEKLCARMSAHPFGDSANIVNDLTDYANEQLVSIIQEDMITSTAMTAFINAKIFHKTVHSQPTPKLNKFLQGVASREAGDPDPVILIPILSRDHYTGFKVNLRTHAIQYFDSLPKSSYSQALEKAPGNTPDEWILPLAHALLFGDSSDTEAHALTVTNESRHVRWSNTCADRLLNWLLGEDAPDSEIDQMIERLERIPARKKIPRAGFEDTFNWSLYASFFISKLSDENNEQQRFKAQLEAAEGQLTQAKTDANEVQIEASATQIKDILVSYFKYVRSHPELFQLQHRTFKQPKGSIQDSQHSEGQLLKNKGLPQNSTTPKEPNQQAQAIDKFQRLELSPINSPIDHENSKGFIGLLIIGLIYSSSGIASLMQDSTSLTALHGVMNTGFSFLAIGALILLSLLADHIACYSMANQSNRVSMKWVMLFSSLMTCASVALMSTGVQAHLISISWMSSGSLPIALITLAGYLFLCGCVVSMLIRDDSSKLNPSSDTSTYETSMNLGVKPTSSPTATNAVVNQLHATQSPLIKS